MFEKELHLQQHRHTFDNKSLIIKYRHLRDFSTRRCSRYKRLYRITN